VAYESQLKSDRAQLHRRLAAAIEQHDPGSADQNAALIAEHLETAGDLHAAYGWHIDHRTAALLHWPRSAVAADTQYSASVFGPNLLGGLNKFWVIRELMLLRLRALLAQTRGATARYRDLVERYRTMATSLGYEGQVAWAEAMK
jgi:hypothetical protein